MLYLKCYACAAAVAGTAAKCPISLPCGVYIGSINAIKKSLTESLMDVIPNSQEEKTQNFFVQRVSFFLELRMRLRPVNKIGRAHV